MQPRPLKTRDVIDLSNLRPDRPMALAEIWNPEVQALVDGQLVYSPLARPFPTTRDTRPDGRKLTRTLVIEFADLADAEDAAILRFARRWGVLVVGEDGWRKKDAFYEWQLLSDSDLRAKADAKRKWLDSRTENSEPIAGWRNNRSPLPRCDRDRGSPQ
jgi:hypothetical protein